MKTLQTKAKIDTNGQLIVNVPVDMPAGEYQIVLVIEENPLKKEKSSLIDFPTHDIGSWNSNLSLRREDMYGNDER
jgi:hypothetical protein